MTDLFPLEEIPLQSSGTKYYQEDVLPGFSHRADGAPLKANEPHLGVSNYSYAVFSDTFLASYDWASRSSRDTEPDRNR